MRRLIVISLILIACGNNEDVQSKLGINKKILYYQDVKDISSKLISKTVPESGKMAYDFVNSFLIRERNTVYDAYDGASPYLTYSNPTGRVVWNNVVQTKYPVVVISECLREELNHLLRALRVSFKLTDYAVCARIRLINVSSQFDLEEGNRFFLFGVNDDIHLLMREMRVPEPIVQHIPMIIDKTDNEIFSLSFNLDGSEVVDDIFGDSTIRNVFKEIKLPEEAGLSILRDMYGTSNEVMFAPPTLYLKDNGTFSLAKYALE